MIKKRIITLWVLTAVVSATFLYVSQFACAQEETIHFGSAKVDITPPVGTPLSGFGKRHGKPSKGIHDPLYARVIRLEKDSRSFFFVSLDLALIDENFREEIIKKVRKQIDVPETNIVLFATHTHSGSGAIGKRFWERMIGGRFNQQVFDQMTGLIAKAVVESSRTKIPVAIEWGEIDAHSLVENRMDPDLSIPAMLKINVRPRVKPCPADRSNRNSMPCLPAR